MAELVDVATSLVGIIRKLILQCEQGRHNAQLTEELHTFLQSLQDFIQQTQENALAVRNNSTVWALGSLREDLENAILDASNILNNGFVCSLWDGNKIQSRIHALRERIMTSFQTRLSLATLNVALESKRAQDTFQEAMLKVNKELQESCFTTSPSLKKEQRLVLRKELRQALQPITTALESHSHKIEAAMSMIHSWHPQTSDAEKFFEDVLSALDDLSVKNQGDAASKPPSVTHASGSAKRRSGLVKWYKDPVTSEIMCDPVKATDGHTYDRWTMLGEHGHMATSPFRSGDVRPLHIAIDDLDVRSRLFQKFPEQESQFRAKRTAYRDTALHEGQLGHFAESASMLKHVLEWDPDDLECSEKLEYVQRKMGAACGKSIASADEVDQNWQDAGIQFDDTYNSATLVQHQHLYPSCLDRARSNRDFLLLSPDGLSCRYIIRSADKSDNVGAAIADMAVPELDELRRSTIVFYFEITIERLDMELHYNGVGLGFTGSKDFCNNLWPGCYPNSCGYHFGGKRTIYAHGRQVEVEGEAHEQPTAIALRQGDRWGAGIHHGYKEIFFVYNGSLIGVISNTLAGAVMPVVALGSPRVKLYVKVAFNESAFCPEQRPSRLVIPSSIGGRPLSLSSDGLLITCTKPNSGRGLFSKKSLRLFSKNYVFLRADYGARFRCQSYYYFELTVVDLEFSADVAIGFAHRGFVKSNWQPGDQYCRNTCAYWNNGLMFFGRRYLAEFVSSFGKGDTIGAGIDCASGTIFFTKNGKAVHHTRRLRMSCAFYPVIGMCNGFDSVVSLNFGQAPFSFDTASIALNVDARILGQPTRLCRPNYGYGNVELSQDCLTMYMVGTSQVALFADHTLIWTFPSSSEVFYFELKVLHQVVGSYIAIGFCNQDDFDSEKQPGMYLNSCGYNADDRKLWICGTSSEGTYRRTVSNRDVIGDVIGAGIYFPTNTIFFAHNGRLVGQTRHMYIPYALLPIVGLEHLGQEVHLNFGKAPFSFAFKPLLTGFMA